MKWWMTSGIAVVGGLVLTTLCAQGPPSKMAVKKGWLLNYEQGRAQARKTNRPMLVVFRCEP